MTGRPEMDGPDVTHYSMFEADWCKGKRVSGDRLAMIRHKKTLSLDLQPWARSPISVVMMNAWCGARAKLTPVHLRGKMACHRRKSYNVIARVLPCSQQGPSGQCTWFFIAGDLSSLKSKNKLLLLVRKVTHTTSFFKMALQKWLFADLIPNLIINSVFFDLCGYKFSVCTWSHSVFFQAPTFSSSRLRLV